VLTGCSPFTVDGDKNSTQDIARRILTKAVPFPKGMNEAAKSFISGLLEKDPRKRLGARGVDQIKSHPFFMNINWSAMEQRKVKPPLKPKVSSQVNWFVLLFS
jgi:serine/threonine protein kinase